MDKKEDKVLQDDTIYYQKDIYWKKMKEAVYKESNGEYGILEGFKKYYRKTGNPIRVYHFIHYKCGTEWWTRKDSWHGTKRKYCPNLSCVNERKKQTIKDKYGKGGLKNCQQKRKEKRIAKIQNGKDDIRNNTIENLLTKYQSIFEFLNIQDLYNCSSIEECKFKVRCKECNTEFETRFIKHSSTALKGCPNCGSNISFFEKEVRSFLTDNGIEIITNSRELLDGKEIDIYIPKIKLGIECCGMYFHSSSPHSSYGKPKSKDYHYLKRLLAKEKNIHLIHLYESEWENNPELIKSKLLHYCKIDNNEKIYARKCKIKQITYSQTTPFLNNYHTQGATKATYHFGAFTDQEELVAVMTFGKNFRSEKEILELSRFATKTNYRVIGIFSKMLNYFFKNTSAEEIYSFGDLRWVDEDNNVYKNNNWELVNISKSDYGYYNNREHKLYHKSKYQKSNLKILFPDIYDEKLTEFENIDKINYIFRIYDCGKLKYTYKRRKR